MAIRKIVVELDDNGTEVKTYLKGPTDRPQVKVCSTEGDDISFKRSDAAFNNSNKRFLRRETSSGEN